jgi:hypothetical protein
MSDIARLWQPAGETGFPQVALLESLDLFAKFVEQVAHRERASPAVTKSEVQLARALAKGFRDHECDPDYVLASRQLPNSKTLEKSNYVWASLASAYSDYAVSMQEEACNRDRLPVVCVVRCWSDQRKGRDAEFQLWVECGSDVGSTEIWPELTLALAHRRVPQLQLFAKPGLKKAEDATDTSYSAQPPTSSTSSPASTAEDVPAAHQADATTSSGAGDGNAEDQAGDGEPSSQSTPDPTSTQDLEHTYRMAKLLLEHEKKDSGVVAWIAFVLILIGIYVIWPPGLLGLGLQP